MPITQIPGSFDTEKPLDMDYFAQEEKVDTETIRSFLAEYNRIGGLTVSWYRLQDPNLGMDPVFLEKADKKWCRPIKIKAVFQYLEEMIENQRYGIQILDEVNLVIEKKYWTEITKVDSPKIGDLFYIDHIKLMFEVVNLVDSDANFWGQKLTWKTTAKIWQEAHDDKEITKDVVEPGWAPDEPDHDAFTPNEPVEQKAETLHTYKSGESPFGDY